MNVPLASRLLPFAVAPLLAPAAAAQIRFDTYPTRHLPALLPAPLYDSGWPIQANGFAAGDVDGDGDLDFAVACNSSPPMLFRNDGHGVFEGEVLPGTRSTFVALADVDGDGDLDLFFAGGTTTYGGPAPCALLANDGSGAFTPFGSLPATATSANVLYAGDVDHDGDIDFLVSGSPWLYLRNDGGGTFTDQTASLPSLGALCDLNGDGIQDLFDGTTYRRGNGDGTFTAFPLSVQGEPVGDLDGDGDVDMIGTVGSATTVRPLLNDGTGLQFTAVGSLPTQNSLLYYSVLRVHDVDGDGRRELLCLDRNARPVVLRHNGNFAFIDVTNSWCEPQVATSVDNVWTAGLLFDVDGDGDLDWITGGAEGRGPSSTTVGIPPRLYLDTGVAPGPRYVEATRTPFPRMQTVAAPAAAGDVDGDGDIDLVFDRLWLQDEHGRYVPGPALPPPLTFPFNAICGPGLLEDLDGDGDLDLFLTDGPGRGGFGYAGRPRLCRNVGGGVFTAVATPSTVSTVGSACAAGDVDGDGDLDIVLGSYPDFFTGATGERIVLLRNDGNMIFVDAGSQMPALLFETGALSLRDFDGDGDLDLLVARDQAYGSTPSVLFFANDGTGHFTDQTATHLPANILGYRLAVADLDGDGDLDFAQQAVSGGGGFVFTNAGNGVFTAAPAARGTHIVDWTGDGTLVDLFDARSDGFAIGGTYVPWSGGFGGPTATSLLPFDYDQDGDLDLAVGTLFNSSPSTTVFHQGLVVNLHRDLRLASQPRLGQPFRARVRAVNGTAATAVWIGVGTTLLPQRVPVPALGHGLLAVDPAQLLALDLVVVPDADTAAETLHAVPSLPAILGMQLATQALFVPIGHEADAHFSGVIVERIGR